MHAQRVGEDGLDDVAVGHDGAHGVRRRAGRSSRGRRRPPGPACRASTRRPPRGRSSPTGATAPPSTAGPWPASSARRRSSRRSGTSPSRSSTCRSTGRVPVEHQLGRLQAALQRAGDDRGERYGGEPAGQRRDLGPAGVVEADALGPAGQDTGAFAVVRPWRTSRTVVTVNEPTGQAQWVRDRRLRAVPPRDPRAHPGQLAGRTEDGPLRAERVRLDRPPRPDRGRARPGGRGLRPAPAGRRGRAQGPPAAQGRAVRRLPVHRPQDGALRRGDASRSSSAT